MKIKELLEVLSKIDPETLVKIGYCYTEDSPVVRHTRNMIEEVYTVALNHDNKLGNYVLIGPNRICDKLLYPEDKE